MTIVEANLTDFPDVQCDEGTVLTVLVNAWGVVDAESTFIPDVMLVPDLVGEFSTELVPTTNDDGFYSVQLSWLDSGAINNRFLRIRVPVGGPVRLVDLVVSDDDG